MREQAPPALTCSGTVHLPLCWGYDGPGKGACDAHFQGTENGYSQAQESHLHSDLIRCVLIHGQGSQGQAGVSTQPGLGS